MSAVTSLRVLPGLLSSKASQRLLVPGLLLMLLGSMLATPSLADPSPEFQGEWIQGAPLSGRVVPGSKVRFAGREVRVDAQGRFAIGLAFDAPPAAELEVIDADGAVRRHEFTVVQRDYPTQRINGLPKKMVTPPKEVLERIRDDRERVVAARDIDSDNPAALGDFDWPLSARVTGIFGARRVLNGKPRQPHFGIDLAAPKGTPIKAPAAATVRMADKDLYYTGGTVILDHGHGYTTTYLHLSKIDVEVGQVLERGQVIGLVGATGRATGPHLCWRANWFDVRLDPSLLVDTSAARKGETKP